MLTLRKFLCEPGAPKELHPLIESFRVIEQKKDAEGRQVIVVEYTDNLVILGCLRKKLKYVATSTQLATDSSATMQLQFTTGSSGTHVEHLYSVTSLSDGKCSVTDAVKIQAPALMRGYVHRTARSAHTSMMDNLQLKYT